jgi:hypothetical protein
MLSLPLDRLLGSLGETLVMTAVSGAISFAVGLPLGLILVGTAPGGLWENRGANRIVGAIVNGFRSLPFIILLVPASILIQRRGRLCQNWLQEQGRSERLCRPVANKNSVLREEVRLQRPPEEGPQSACLEHSADHGDRALCQ